MIAHFIGMSMQREPHVRCAAKDDTRYGTRKNLRKWYGSFLSIPACSGINTIKYLILDLYKMSVAHVLHS
jgi:hypothetical protein